MASNLRSARQAIRAELDHAKKGMAYYRSRTESLQNALEELERVDSSVASPSKSVKVQGNGNAANVPGAKRGRKPRAVARVKGKDGATVLPTTGGDFWITLITDRRQAAVEIASAAAQSLGLDPNRDRQQILVLKQRATPALNGLVAAQRIQDSGTGRERRFFKP